MTKSMVDANGNDVPLFVPGTSYNTAYTGTAGTQAALTSGCRMIRVICTTDAYVKVGIGVTATASHMLVIADVVTLIPVSESYVVSAIQHTSGGNLHVTEMW